MLLEVIDALKIESELSHLIVAFRVPHKVPPREEFTAAANLFSLDMFFSDPLTEKKLLMLRAAVVQRSLEAIGIKKPKDTMEPISKHWGAYYEYAYDKFLCAACGSGNTTIRHYFKAVPERMCVLCRECGNWESNENPNQEELADIKKFGKLLENA